VNAVLCKLLKALHMQGLFFYRYNVFILLTSLTALWDFTFCIYAVFMVDSEYANQQFVYNESIVNQCEYR